MLVMEGYRDRVIAIVIVEVVALHDRNYKKELTLILRSSASLTLFYTPHCLYCWYLCMCRCIEEVYRYGSCIIGGSDSFLLCFTQYPVLVVDSHNITRRYLSVLQTSGKVIRVLTRFSIYHKDNHSTHSTVIFHTTRYLRLERQREYLDVRFVSTMEGRD